jgi:hypothetical protein
MDIPNQKLGRMSMESKTLEMTITDDGYRYIAGMLIANVLENIKPRKDWAIGDATVLVLGAIKIARNLPEAEFDLLISSLEERYNV